MASVAAQGVKSAAKSIVLVDGVAFVRDASGKETPLQVGQPLQEGQVIFTSATGHATLLLPNGQVVELAAGRDMLIDGDLSGGATTDVTEARVAQADTSADQIITALNQGKDLSDELEATAAGLNGAGAEGEGAGFVRLLRIAENVSPVSFNFSANGAAPDLTVPEYATLPQPEPEIVLPPEPPVETPSITIGNPSAAAGNTNDITVAEGKDAVFAVHVEKAAAGSTLTLTLADGTALSPSDYSK
ncbi:retention module-containing protein, partial [Chitinibacter sp. ZOR0017]|uniref:retention module-containing protein n=1 Tax=Chitinibacter sp. ZOR0017 TaxID=1339254 RepID=UPI000648C831